MSSEDGLDVEDIEELFVEARLDFKRVSASTWQTSFDGETNKFLIRVAKERWGLSFSIRPYVPAPQDRACRLALYTHLLELNRQMPYTKFTLESPHTVIFTMEIVLNKKSPLPLESAFEAFCSHADSHYLDILNMAQERHLP